MAISTMTFTSTPIESGLDLILSHLEKPYFPRRISAYITEKTPPWQILVYSKEEALAMFKAHISNRSISNWHDCNDLQVF
jgi:hypothetical protein